MIYFNAFIFCGIICLLAEIILDNTNLTIGHITSIFVVIGSFLDTFDIYDKLIDFAGGGALVPITSFGHSIMHGCAAKMSSDGIIGLITGMLDTTAPGIVGAVIISFFLSLIFNSKN